MAKQSARCLALKSDGCSMENDAERLAAAKGGSKATDAPNMDTRDRLRRESRFCWRGTGAKRFSPTRRGFPIQRGLRLPSCWPPGGQSFCKNGPIYREQAPHMPVVILERGFDLPGGEMIIKSGVLAPVTASGGAIICAMALAGWWFARMPQSGPASTPRPLESLASHSSLEQRALSPDALGAVAPSAASSGPRIDVARIMPNGDVVIAGWAEPGARVALVDGGDTLQEMQADPTTGEFVFLPPRLGAGAHQMSLRIMNSSDGAQTKEIAIQTFSILPQIKTSNAGNLAPAGPAVDQEPRAFGRGASSGKATTIMRGDTLWRISRERLGRGSLYPTIYEANSKNIRDPNLIYPGRTLMIP